MFTCRICFVVLIAARALTSAADDRTYDWRGARISFALELGHRADPEPGRTVTAAEMRTFAATTNADGTVALVWTGHPLCGEEFRVSAELKPSEDGLVYSFCYSGNEGGWDVENVLFPDIAVPRTDESRVLYPRELGALFRPDWAKEAPGALCCEQGPAYQGFKFNALVTEGHPGWYIDLRDDARRYTTLFRDFNGNAPRTARLAAVHVMPVTDANSRDYALPYGGLIARFDGGWHAAAALYRKWVRTQDWYKTGESRFAANKQLRDIGLWVWNRGRSEQVVPPVERVAQDTGAPVALDWYWWHENPYGANGPRYWPPREGTGAFVRAVAGLREKGVYVQAYMNGELRDADDPLNAEIWPREVAYRRSGEPDIYTFNPFLGHRSAWICGEAPAFQDLVADICRRMAGTGLDGVYIDVVGHAANFGCWNPAHGHVRGGGRHFADGYARMLERIRRENPGTDLSTEEGTEAFFEHFDSLIMPSIDYERMGAGTAPDFEGVPVYEAIYHGAVAMFGSYAVIDHAVPWDEKWPERFRRKDGDDWMERFPDEFAVDFMRPVVFGVQPCVLNLALRHAEEPRFAADYRLILDTVRFYRSNRDFLLDGEMLDPGRIETETRSVSFLKRSVYSKQGEFDVFKQPALPAVFHSVWRARDGRVAAVVANWTRTERPYAIATPDIRAAGRLPARSWRLVSLDEKERIGE